MNVFPSHRFSFFPRAIILITFTIFFLISPLFVGIAKAEGIDIPILMYHGVDTEVYSELTVSVDLFTKQMDALAAYGYDPVTLQDYLNYRDGSATPPDHPIILTFDDGPWNFYTYARPVLNARNQNATLFIPTDFIGETEDDRVDEHFMVWDPEIQTLYNEGFQIESHTISHPDLLELSSEQAWEEIMDSRVIIQDHLGNPVDFFCYPYGNGAYDWEILGYVQDAGYRAAVAAWPDGIANTDSSDIWALPRITMNDDLSTDLDPSDPEEFFMYAINPDFPIPDIVIDDVEFLHQDGTPGTTFSPGETIIAVITLSNYGDSVDLQVNLELDDDDDYWDYAYYDGVLSGDLENDETKTFEMQVTIPYDVDFGQHYYAVSIKDEHFVLGFQYSDWEAAFGIYDTTLIPPSDLSTEPLAQTRIYLTWTDNSDNESGFKIERSPNGTSSWTHIATVEADVISYLNRGLSCGTPYYYRVQAYNAGGDSDYSNVASSTTVVCAPATPSDLTAASVSQTRIGLNWIDHSSVESGFRVERSLNGTSGWVQIATVDANVTGYNDAGLDCGTSYYYRVRAYNAGDNSDYSNVADSTTVVCAPAAPTDLSAVAVCQAQIDLSWTDASDNETGFQVEHSPDGVAWTPLVTTAANTTNYTDRGLVCGTGHHYRVRAYNTGGHSKYSTPAYVTTVACKPAAPTNLSAVTVSQTRIDLTWTDASNNETGFQVERSPDGLTWTPQVTTTTNITSYTDAGLACGTAYHYRVRAYNAGGSSGYSNVAGSTTVVCAPAAPTDLSAVTISQTQIDLTWTDASDNETGFQVERSPDGLTWTPLVTTTANITSYTDAGLACGMAYHYRMRAYNAGGSSGYSNVADSTTVVCAPAAPTDLSAVTVSQTEIALTWTDASNNETGFQVERSPDGLTWTPLITTTANITSYTDAGLACGTGYHYRVRAYNAGGTSTYSATAHATTAVCTPAAPTDLSAVTISQTQIDLSWTDASDNETGFQVEHSPDGLTWTPLVTTTTNITSYTDAGLTCGTAYHYRVRAYNTGGSSGYSNVAGSTTVVCAPAAPTDLSAVTISQTQIDLTWIDTSDNETGFQVERSPDGLTWTPLVTTTTNITSYIDARLACGTAYHYRVRAYNAGGSSGYSNVAGSTTVVCAPAATTDLSAVTVSQAQIGLTWTDASDNETGFQVERSPDGLTWTPLVTTMPNITSYTDAGLTCGTAYHYRVRAYNAGGSSSYSNVAGSTTVVCAPAAPTDLSAVTISQARIDLTWNDTSDNETGFQVERSPDGLAWTPLITTTDNVTSYTDAGLACGTAYHYRVRAYNAGGSSGYSNVADSTTVVCAMAAPTDLSAVTISQTEITLTWTDASDNETGFQVERSPDGLTWTPLVTTTANVTSYIDARLACGTLYHYRVRAYNAGGTSAYSATAHATTAVCTPAAPTDLSAVTVSQTQVDLTWTDASDNETGFQVERSPDGLAWTPLVTTTENITSYADMGLVCGTTYTYRVWAYNAGGNSGYDNTTNATTQACTPPSSRLYFPIVIKTETR